MAEDEVEAPAYEVLDDRWSVIDGYCHVCGKPAIRDPFGARRCQNCTALEALCWCRR